MIDMEANRARFEAELRKTGRKGVENALAELDRLGFFTAPASTRFHGSEPGGLAAHSLNVYDEARIIWATQAKLRPDIAERIGEDSVAIVALLHDICKAEVYRQEIKHRKNANGKWEDYTGYGVDYSDFPVGHGEKSVIRLLQWGVELRDDEILAIRWHMGGFDLPFQSAEAKACYGAAGEKSPLVSILCAADGLASHVIEAN